MERNQLDLIGIALGSVGFLVGGIRAQWRGMRAPAWLVIAPIVLMIVALLLSRYTQTHPLLISASVGSLAVAAALFVRAWRRSVAAVP